MKRALWLALLCLLLPLKASAAPPQPFTEHSLADIKKRYAYKPFVLVLWSVSCSYCMEALPEWGSLQARYPHVPIVLVNTDVPAEQMGVPDLLRNKQLDKVASYMFADVSHERLRWHIDPKWRGELPRHYLFNAQHQAEAHSGMLDKKQLETWLVRMSRPPRLLGKEYPL